MKKKIAIAVGGSGGHLYPAQALAEQIIKQNPQDQILFLGGGLACNKYFDRTRFSYCDIPCGPVSLSRPLQLASSSYSILKGTINSYSTLSNFSPDLVIGFGSYHTLPVLLGAKCAKIPLLLYAADSVPGKVIRFFSPYSNATAIHFPLAASYLKGKCVEVAMPLRDRYRLDDVSKEQASNYFQISSQRLTILIFGGSQGAQNLNKIISEKIVQSCFSTTYQILHFTGDSEMTRRLKCHYEKYKISACVKTFETNMHMAWSLADLAITRAGASSLAEQIQFTVPAILVPYPYAMDDHQKKNAEYFANVVKGAEMILEGDLPLKLEETVSSLLSDDRKGLRRMREAMIQYKCRPQCRELHCLVDELLRRGS